jgi:hypothetical protein
VAVALAGLSVVLLGGIVALLELPGSVPKGTVDTTGQNVVAIASAAFTAVAAVVSAYFGIKAANTAREDTSKVAENMTRSAQRSEIRAAHFAAAEPGNLATAAQEAAAEIKQLGLDS